MKKLIREEFWKQHSNVVVWLSDNTFKFGEDKQDEVIDSQTSALCVERCRKFLDKKVGRTVLLYGPPGTGKSNMVRSIAKNIGGNSLRIDFNDIKNINSTLLRELFNWLNPDIVIMEDIDHADLAKNCHVLSNMEAINKSGKLILATTNEVKSINPALLRPGRFDELIEVNKFDPNVLLEIVNGDREIFEIVKNFPIAFTQELLIRIKVLGREEALANIEDLTKRFKNLSKMNCEL